MNLERPEFLKLVKDILEGKFRGGKVIASTFDRVCRFAIHLVEYLCQLGGATLEYVLDSDEGEKSGNESLVQDVLSILTHYSARASGAKTKQIVTVHMKQSDLDEAWELYSKKSWSQAAINDKFVREGRTGTTASGKVKRLTRGPVYRRLTTWFELKRKVAGETQQVNSFELWSQTHIKKIQDGGKFNEVRLTTLRAQYVDYCKKNDLHPIHNRGILKFLTEQGFESYTDRGGIRHYKSMMLLEDRARG